MDRLAGMTERFCTLLDCVDIGFVPDGLLDELPQPSRIGATQTGGVDLNKPRIRAALAAVLLREHIIAPILAGVRTPRRGRKPATWTKTDQDYETLRINMHTLFHDLGIGTALAA